MDIQKTSKKRSKLIINSLLLFAFCLLCYEMGQWTIPFIIALVLAYAFHIPLKKISKKLHLSNTYSATIIVLFILSLVSIFTVFLIPLLKNATVILVQKLPDLLQTFPDSINTTLHNAVASLGIDKNFDIGTVFKKYLIELTTDWPNHMLNFINTGVTLVYIIMFVFMTPVITFYLLKDWNKIEISFNAILNKVASKTVISILQSINYKLGAYIKGQLLVCIILSILYTVGLFFIGVDQYIVCGIFSGTLSIAPFFGPFIGLLTTLAMALDTFTFSHQYILTICLYVAIPFMDSNFITPKFIGKSTGIQPVWLLFSICATVSVLGTMGIFISVPMAVVLSTVCKEIVKRL